MGQILLSFSYNNETGATSFLGLDYNITVVKFPPISNFAWTFDVFIDYPLSSGDIAILETDYKNYDYNKLHLNDGDAMYAQCGYQIGIGKIEPIFRYQNFDSSFEGKDITDYYIGIAYWIDKYKANLKAEYMFDDKD